MLRALRHTVPSLSQSHRAGDRYHLSTYSNDEMGSEKLRELSKLTEQSWGETPGCVTRPNFSPILREVPGP